MCTLPAGHGQCGGLVLGRGRSAASWLAPQILFSTFQTVSRRGVKSLGRA